MLEKRELRQETIDRRNSMPEGVWTQACKDLEEQILNSCYYMEASSIFSFVSFGREVETKSLIERALEDGKRVYVPLTRKGDKEMTMVEIQGLDELVPGHMGILNPRGDLLPSRVRQEVDLVLVPGLLFDDGGYRLGYGGGYYDIFLAKVPHKHRLGLGFAWQRVPSLPREDFDISLEGLITEEGIELF